MAAPPREIQPGELLTARWLNALLKVAKRKNAIKVMAPLTMTDANADGVITLGFSGPQEAYFSITGGTNPYAGTEQKADTGGAWSAISGGRTPTTGVDPLYERNANTAVPIGSVVLARRATATSSWVFPFSACAATATTPPVTATAPVPAPGPGPSTIPMTPPVIDEDPADEPTEEPLPPSDPPLPPLPPEPPLPTDDDGTVHPIPVSYPPSSPEPTYPAPPSPPMPPYESPPWSPRMPVSDPMPDSPVAGPDPGPYPSDTPTTGESGGAPTGNEPEPPP